MLPVRPSIFPRAAVLSSAAFPRSLRTAICPSSCPMAQAFQRTCFVSHVLVVFRSSRTLRAIESPRVCSWIWIIVPSTCCAFRICRHTAVRFAFLCFTARRSSVCWKSAGNALRRRLPMTLMYSRSFAITCLSSWSVWHRACARVVPQSLAARSMCCAMSSLPILTIRSPLRVLYRPKSALCLIAISALWSTMRALNALSSILRAAVVWRCQGTRSRSFFRLRRLLRVWGPLRMALKCQSWAVRALTT